MVFFRVIKLFEKMLLFNIENCVYVYLFIGRIFKVFVGYF